MTSSASSKMTYDLFVIGGGINGCGIARDAAGRGLSVGLAEMADIGGATSSASTKLFHGGLRYLEYFEIKLVRHALREREILWRAMPHISRPMRFVLPYHPDMRFESTTPVSRILNRVMPWMKGRRPSWLIRLGLFLYDHLGGRKVLPGTSSLNLHAGAEGAPLKKKFRRAYEYSDCWVDDARLVALNARDAKERGADILVRTKVISARRSGAQWEITLEDQLDRRQWMVTARMIVNAAGPWVADVMKERLGLNSSESVRLVRGSHIVTRKLYDHDKCYFLQGEDGRIIFAIPYESDFTLIGTTDVEHGKVDAVPTCTAQETEYLIGFANQYFERPISTGDIVWSYSGVRPLYDDGAASASATTRDYVLSLDTSGEAPLLSVFGGKITTYRCLAEDALEKVAEHFPKLSGKWTAGAPLPGGEFPMEGKADLVARLAAKHTFLSNRWAARLVSAYGTDAFKILAGASSPSDLGRAFGADLTQREVEWLIEKEFARSADDILWRRSKIGLRMSDDDKLALSIWMTKRVAQLAA